MLDFDLSDHLNCEHAITIIQNKNKLLKKIEFFSTNLIIFWGILFLALVQGRYSSIYFFYTVYIIFVIFAAMVYLKLMIEYISVENRQLIFILLKNPTVFSDPLVFSEQIRRNRSFLEISFKGLLITFCISIIFFTHVYFQGMTAQFREVGLTINLTLFLSSTVMFISTIMKYKALNMADGSQSFGKENHEYNNL